MNDERESTARQSDLVPSKGDLAVASSGLVRRGLETARKLLSRILHFPAGASSGVLYIREPDDQWDMPSDEWQRFADALGNVIVPPGKELRLDVYLTDSQSLSALAALRPGDLAELRLNGHPVTESDLADLVCLDGLMSLSFSPVGVLNWSLVEETVLARIGRLSRLKKLDLAWTTTSDNGLMFLVGLTRLGDLSLSGLKVTGEGLAVLQSTPCLYALDLSYSTIEDDSLKHLAELLWLEKLSIANTEISNVGLSYLQGSTRLRDLDLSRTKITDQGLTILPKLPDLMNLSMAALPISNGGMAHVAQLTNLVELSLRGTLISDGALPHIANLIWLKSLDLGGTQITSNSLLNLKNLSGLTSLGLSNTQIDDAALVHLASLTSLKSLDLEQTRITDTGLQHLGHLPDLSWVDLAETGVTASGILRFPEKSFLAVNLSIEQITKDEFSELRERRSNWLFSFGDEMGNYDRAVDQKADTYHILGQLKLEEGDLDGAIIKFSKVLSMKPDHVGAHNGLGMVLMEKGDLDGAIGTYREAIRIDPKAPEPYYNLGIVLRRVGRQVEAVWAIKEFLRLAENAHSTRVWIDRAQTILVELEKER